jgi:hypothetical protein
MKTEPHDINKPGIPALISGIIQDAVNLVSKELAAARLEIREEVDKAKSAAVLMGVGAGALVIGGILLCLMLVHLLQTLTDFDLWICYGIVGLTLGLVGVIILYSAKQRASETRLVPTRSVENAKEDARWITHRVKYDAK